jgi:hypothetical protein
MQKRIFSAETKKEIRNNPGLMAEMAKLNNCQVGTINQILSRDSDKLMNYDIVMAVSKNLKRKVDEITEIVEMEAATQ